MAKKPEYKLRFFADDTQLLWGSSDIAKKQYGYSIDPEDLPISAGLVKELNNLGCENINKRVESSLQLEKRIENAYKLLVKLRQELGDSFEIEDLYEKFAQRDWKRSNN